MISLRRNFFLNKKNYRTFNLKNDNKPKIYYNLSYPELLNHEIKNNEGKIMKCKYGDTYSINTGKYTGRSPKDKYIVKNIGSESDKNIWWGNVNKSMDSDTFDYLYSKCMNHFEKLDKVYIFDGYCGSNTKSQKNVRFIHEMAWQQHFVKNMFIEDKNLVNFSDFDPDFTIINACSIINHDWESRNLNSEISITFNIEKKIGIIMGTWYGGENKKGIFSLMNYWLPLQNIMTMHCSSNIGIKNDTALFFGLSGTGKTTLSVDPYRKLIGDDEHGWDEDGIFNFEGGCYAKTINLSEENEPLIYKSIKENALLENVHQNNDKTPNYDNTSITENGRVSYPINHIENYHELQMGDHPKNIIFLTCDAFGILPPISKLTNEQAMYYFLSGYTSKVAGTERGITEPQATFSSCFGEAFLTLHPLKYAELFQNKITKHQSNIYLVNTGWIGGPYGIGKRISISDTRSCIDSIFTGEIENTELIEDKIFKFKYPKKLINLSENICNPRESWNNKSHYDNKSLKLAKMFQDNYNEKFINKSEFTDYSIYGPKLI